MGRAAELAEERLRALTASLDERDITCAGDVEVADLEPEIVVELLDANPMFTTGGAAPGTMEPAAIADLGAVRGGTVADGTSRLVVRVRLSEPGTVTFRLPASTNPDIQPNGRLWPINADPNAKDAEPPGAVTVSSAEVDDDHYALALFEAPEEVGPTIPTSSSALGYGGRRLRSPYGLTVEETATSIIRSLSYGRLSFSSRVPTRRQPNGMTDRIFWVARAWSTRPPPTASALISSTSAVTSQVVV